MIRDLPFSHREGAKLSTMDAHDDGDDTQAAITAVVDSGGTTRCSVEHQVAADELAWSVEDSAPEVVSNRRPLSLPLRLLLISVLVGAVGLAAFVLGGRALPVVARHIAVPAVSVPASSSPPQSIPPPTVAELPPPPPPLTPDEVYLRGLERIGIRNTLNRANAIHVGHQICDDFATGSTFEDIRRAGMKSNPSLSVANVDDITRVSVTAYCPQYRELLH